MAVYSDWEERLVTTADVVGRFTEVQPVPDNTSRAYYLPFWYSLGIPHQCAIDTLSCKIFYLYTVRTWNKVSSANGKSQSCVRSVEESSYFFFSRSRVLFKFDFKSRHPESSLGVNCDDNSFELNLSLSLKNAWVSVPRLLSGHVSIVENLCVYIRLLTYG